MKRIAEYGDCAIVYLGLDTDARAQLRSGDYSLKRNVDPVLYDDLGNHFKSLPEKLSNIENLMKVDYPNYVENLAKLFKSTGKEENDEEYKESNSTDSNQINHLNRAAFMLCLNIETELWTNTHDILQKANKIELAEKIAKRHRSDGEVTTILSIKKQAEEKFGSCIKEIDTIQYRYKLGGVCPYTEGGLRYDFGWLLEQARSLGRYLRNPT